MSVQPDVQMDKAAFLAWVEGREGRYELPGACLDDDRRKSTPVLNLTE